MNLAQPLIGLKREHQFLIGIDSDGCVFDSMEVKQKECFIPATIRVWGLQAVSKYVRAVQEFVTLYSIWRGANRFVTLLKTLELTAARPEVKRRGIRLPDLTPLRTWIAQEKCLGLPALREYVKAHPDPVLERTLQWTLEVNRRISEMVYAGLPPFPLARASLQRMSTVADVIVISQTPKAHLEREWREQEIAQYVKLITSQEMGTKVDHLRLAKADHYRAEQVLMIGDSWGDYRAAQANQACFYPINPGREEESWQRFYEEGLDKFLTGTFTGAYEEALVTEFKRYLPEHPPWA